MSTQREVTTLAVEDQIQQVALAAALSAECCEICSDASCIVQIHALYQRLFCCRLIRCNIHGSNAKVLQAEALQWCCSGITLVANATSQPFGPELDLRLKKLRRFTGDCLR